MLNKTKSGAIALIIAASMTPLAAHADAAKDIVIAGRALTFLENGPTGKVVMGVVFDPSKPASVAEKNAVMAAIGGGLAAGGVTLTGKAIEAGDASGAAGVGALFVTTGANGGAVVSAAKAKKIITIGSDVSCATSGACVMSVSGDPKVEIVVSRSAAAAAGAVFKAAFRMMIREV
ncbi:hypothetical protein B7G68_00355 [Caulobacter segnis]|uniref:Uncharacterized protein n=2 Tax=Caulobacter segnis TaxID=88688 RepID=D5VDP7_CAUST|nr:hypothetical protein [Caulobacter segnis]ADG08597.1 conserved hypothetical protein [Caulobacter segnis ATCC 21756]AVQ00449.1 hypothetical protein B7G68_00355 [Caulobacter segnis]